jgi:hypothetical protein
MKDPHLINTTSFWTLLAILTFSCYSTIGRNILEFSNKKPTDWPVTLPPKEDCILPYVRRSRIEHAT